MVDDLQELNHGTLSSPPPHPFRDTVGSANVPPAQTDHRCASLDSCHSRDEFLISMVNEFLNDNDETAGDEGPPVVEVDSLIDFHHIKELHSNVITSPSLVEDHGAAVVVPTSPPSLLTMVPQTSSSALVVEQSTEMPTLLLTVQNENLPTNVREISYQRFGRFNRNLPAEVHNFKCHLCAFSSKQDKSEQTDISPDDFELDDCLLESNDIVITQNKDGFILHVKKLGNITTAKLTSQDEDQVAAAAVAAATGGHVSQTSSHQQQAQISEMQEVQDVKPTFTTLTTSPSIKLPSSECELINLKKIIPASTTISTHHPHATIIQTQQIQPPHMQQQHQHHHQQQQQQQIQQHHQQQQQQHHHHQQQQHSEHQEIIVHEHHQQQQQQQHHQLQHHAQVQSIVTTSPTSQTINLMGLRNVQITEQKPLVSRIKYSRGKIITPTTGNVQIVQTHDAQTHEITDGTKYEISEIDLNNPQTSAAIISDLVKYAEIDDIELPDGTKIGIGFAPTEITEHMQTSATTAQITTIDVDGTHHQHHELQTHPAQHHQLQTHQIHHIQTSASPSQQQHQQHHVIHQQPQTTTTHVVHHQQLHLQEQDDNTTSVEAILPDTITVHDQPTITKSYTILTARPLKQESSQMSELTQPSATTYELSLSDSSLGPNDDRGDESKYVCRHCGKKYRWKSTLRRHENVECGGKEPCHPCPYCSYKAKQRGNLGVHVRKHHPDKPQLESKRGRKI